MTDELARLAARREILVARASLQRVEIAAHVQDLRERSRLPVVLAALPALALAVGAARASRVARFAAVALVIVRFASRWYSGRSKTRIAADETRITADKGEEGGAAKG